MADTENMRVSVCEHTHAEVVQTRIDDASDEWMCLHSGDPEDDAKAVEIFKKERSIVPRGYSQVCIWPGCIVGLDMVEPFTKMMLDKFNARIEYLEEIETAPDRDKDGRPIEGTGGRNDLFFAVHTDDIIHFAVPRLSYGIRWIEDVYGNGHGDLYPARCANYRTW